MNEPKDNAGCFDASNCSSSVVPGVNDQEEWNQRISKIQDGLEFQPLIEFLERLKE